MSGGISSRAAAFGALKNFGGNSLQLIDDLAAILENFLFSSLLWC
jgi:hypothetical protein